MKTLRAMVIIAVFFLFGCASFSGNVLPKVSSFPTVSEKPSVSVGLSFRQYINNQPVNLFVKTAEEGLQKKVVERFEKSGLYSSVAPSNPNSDITVKIDVKDDGSGSMIMAVITGLSLYIIPSSATDTYKVSANVLNNRKGTENKVELEDFVIQWQQILLLPLMPFCLTPVVANGVQNNLFDTLAIRVHEAAMKTASASVGLPVSEVPTKTSINEKSKSEDLLKRLKTLKDAYDAGLISQDDYEQKKTEIMKGM
jgi:Short C-terminal domain